MFTTSKISKDTVAVLYNAPDKTGIAIRKSGRAYFGTEKYAVTVMDGKIVIDKSVLEQFGLNLEIK